MKNNAIVMIIVGLVIGGGLGFYGGIKYQAGKATLSATMNNTNGGGGGRFAGQGGRFGGGNGALRPTAGKIIASDTTSITVQLQDGSSKIVLLTDKTQVNKAEKATKDDLKNGVQVAVFGMTNSDGSVTAQMIQLNPQFMGGLRRQPNQAAKSPDATEVVVTASNYKFAPNTITVKNGEKTRILLKNSGGSHDFRIDELNLATAVIQDGQEDFVEFTPSKTGTYQFYCSVDGHRQMGMVGTLKVE